MSSPRHVHTPLPDSAGRLICTTCRAMVIIPILSSDDPRLKGAGFQRGGIRVDESGDGGVVGWLTSQYPPLPELLIALWDEPDTFRCSKAPVSFYIDAVASQWIPDKEESLWDQLLLRWYGNLTSKQSK